MLPNLSITFIHLTFVYLLCLTSIDVPITRNVIIGMGLLSDAYYYVMHMRRECRERYLRHRGLSISACITSRSWPLSDKKPMGFLSDSGHDVPWCMPG